jgi:hypothetical protein
VALHERDVPELGDRVIVVRPVILRADEAGHRRRRDAGERVGPVDAHQLEILKKPGVVVALLVGVIREVRRDPGRNRIVVCQRAGAARAFFHQRDGRADDRVGSSEVRRQELP